MGIPATLNMALSSLLISSLNAILAVYGQMYVMILGVYYKLQTFLYLPANGIIQGMRPLIGYNYGAGEHARVRQIFFDSLILISGVMVIGTALCLAIPSSLIGLSPLMQKRFALALLLFALLALALSSLRFLLPFPVHSKDSEKALHHL